MAICEYCNKSYHACSSCGLESWEWDFCTEKCKSSYQNAHKYKIRLFWESLSKEQRSALTEILDDDTLAESLCERYFLEGQ